MILWGGKRGSWHDLELSWQGVTGWFFFGCLSGNRLWRRNLLLCPKTLVITVSTVNRFLILCYFQLLNWCYRCNETLCDVILWLVLSPYFCYPDILSRNLPLNQRFLSFPLNSIFEDLPGSWQAVGPPPYWLGLVTEWLKLYFLTNVCFIHCYIRLKVIIKFLFKNLNFKLNLHNW